MGLLQDSIRVALRSNTISYYENLGYYIPRSKDSRGRMKVKEGTKIIVKIQDLPDGCGMSVYMECDNCGAQFKRIWRDHKTHDGLIYCKACSGVLRRGEKAYNWNPNLTEEDRIVGRDTRGIIDFKKRVMARDNYLCKVCGVKGEVVHHLNGYNWCVEGRVNDNNGVTLCEKCHNNFHSIYGKGNNTKEQFEEWIGLPIGELGGGIFPPARRVICMDNGEIIESAPIAAKVYGVERNSLYQVLNKKYRAIYGKHFLWYDDYMEMNKEDICKYWRWIINK